MSQRHMAVVVDETGAAFTVRARRTVVAAGVWTDALTTAAELRPSRGSHLLVRADRLGDPRAAVNAPVPGEHGRWVFALPRPDGLVAIGISDVPAPGEPADERRPAPPRRPSCSSTPPLPRRSARR